MRYFQSAVFALIFPIFFVGCIENDLPYPTIIGQVDGITVSGTSTAPQIDRNNRTVTIVLADSVDLRRVLITDLSVTKDASCTLDSNMYIDLTNGVDYEIAGPYDFTISTYQTYDWQLIASQPIDRKIKLSGSIGDAEIDTRNHTAIAYVSMEQSLYTIVVDEFQLAPSRAQYTPNPFAISDFSEPVEIQVSYLDFVEDWTILVQQTERNVITGSANPWSTFAYIAGDVLASSMLKAGFEYRELGGVDWIAVDSRAVNGKINAVITGLKPNNHYEFRAFLGEEFGDPVEFRTEAMPAIENLKFDQAYINSNKIPVWYFNADGTNSFWATGNEGVTGFGSYRPSNSTSVEGSEAVSGRAVRMETYNGLEPVKVAAGNIFTGVYTGGMSLDPVTLMNYAQMGRPYSGRPTSLSGYYRYSPAVIGADSYWPTAASAFGMNFADSVGRNDWCHIYVALERWPDGSSVRPSNPDDIIKIGYGELVSNQPVALYTQFNIAIEYSDLVTVPTHISIVATSSKNGGYFCGAAGSVLFIDEFSLGWEYLGGSE